MQPFEVVSGFEPAGDQPEAVRELVEGLRRGDKAQVLLGVTGSGKSLPGDEFVWIQRQGTSGLERELATIGPLVDAMLESHLKDIEKDGDHETLRAAPGMPEFRALSIDPATLETSFRKITAFTRHASPATLFRITTRCGRSVTVTGDHNIWALRDGDLRLFESKDLKAGDLIPAPLDLGPGPLRDLENVDLTSYLRSSERLFGPSGEWLTSMTEERGRAKVIEALGQAGVNQPEARYIGAIRSNERLRLNRLLQTAASLGVELPGDLEVASLHDDHALKLRLPVSDDLLKLIGYYIAEGHATSTYLLISAFEREQQEDVLSCLAGLGIRSAVRSNGGDIQISSMTWAILLSSLCGSNSRDKQLPTFWTKLSDRQLGVLLRSYFSADGGVDGEMVTASTASRRLASELSYALSSLSICARFRVTRKKPAGTAVPLRAYRLISISGQEALSRFQKAIGFTLERKSKALQALLGRQAHSNVDLIPVSGSELRKAREAAGMPQRELSRAAGYSREMLSMIENGHRRPTRRAFSRWLDSLNGRLAPTTREKFSRLARCRWTELKACVPIPPSSRFVYDFSVETNETFLAGTGIFVHNTFTMAKAIEQLGRPVLVLSPNKVLAAQLYSEFKAFFPKNAVEYFISYYDYYQPEAYVPSTDTYIEKDASINDHIDRLRLKATSSLLSRRDVIVVASVSCIYNIGSPENYKEMCVPIEVGKPLSRSELLEALVAIYYERNEVEFLRGRFRVKGGSVDIFPAYSETALRVELGDGIVSDIHEFHPVSGKKLGTVNSAFVYPAKHYVTTPPELEKALGTIQLELQTRLTEFRSAGKGLEAQRLEQRTSYDMEMLKELGFCHGIENYSRHLSGRPPGARPWCLLDFFPEDFLMFVDESHVALPQVRGMYEGDRVRKQTLVDFGFRLPSCLDNRPLRFDEFEALLKQAVFVSATPNPYELKASGGTFIEQVIRPTGLVDPEVFVRPTEGQIEDLIAEIQKRVARKERTLVTTLTKRTAEDLANFLTGRGLQVRYLHSDIDSLTRIDILRDLRLGAFDVLVGINLLREGLDLPEVSLVAILDAGNEGFLRSETTLIQISGRAARHVNGQVIFYSDTRTGSMSRALAEMDRRRVKQLEHNKLHGITPTSIVKAVHDLEEFQHEAKRQGLALLRDVETGPLSKETLPKVIEEVERRMSAAADSLDYELAAVLRDQLFELKGMSPAGRKGSARKGSARKKR